MFKFRGTENMAVCMFTFRGTENMTVCMFIRRGIEHMTFGYPNSEEQKTWQFGFSN